MIFHWCYGIHAFDACSWHRALGAVRPWHLAHTRSFVPKWPCFLFLSSLSTPLAKLITYSLRPGPSTSFKDLLSRDNLSIHYEDMLPPVDFTILVEFNGGFDIGVLLLGLIAKIIRI